MAKQVNINGVSYTEYNYDEWIRKVNGGFTGAGVEFFSIQNYAKSQDDKDYFASFFAPGKINNQADLDFYYSEKYRIIKGDVLVDVINTNSTAPNTNNTTSVNTSKENQPENSADAPKESWFARNLKTIVIVSLLGIATGSLFYYFKK